MTCILDDDEADIEAEIQRELEALGDDSLQIEDVEDSIPNNTVKTDEVRTNNQLTFYRTLWNLLLLNIILIRMPQIDVVS